MKVIVGCFLISAVLQSTTAAFSNHRMRTCCFRSCRPVPDGSLTAAYPATASSVVHNKLCRSFTLQAKSTTTDDETKALPFFLDPGTRGGALVCMVLLFILPVTAYNVTVKQFGMDEIAAGRTIGVGFTVVSLVSWLATLLIRIINKDMTYAKQLKSYENAVLEKRLEELDEDEVQALVESVDREGTTRSLK